MSKHRKTPWPRLSVDLPGPKHPFQCQSCGLAPDDHMLLDRWRECDELDRPEPITVVLCKPCSQRLIEPHPRLYRDMHIFEPMPGVMELCLDCRHRDGVSCTNPKAQINGGPGLNVIYPKPQQVHLCRSGGRSGWHNFYQGPATACDGRET